MRVSILFFYCWYCFIYLFIYIYLFIFIYLYLFIYIYLFIFIYLYLVNGHYRHLLHDIFGDLLTVFSVFVPIYHQFLHVNSALSLFRQVIKALSLFRQVIMALSLLGKCLFIYYMCRLLRARVCMLCRRACGCVVSAHACVVHHNPVTCTLILL